MFEICHWSDCSVNAHANISALFLTVCAFGCKSSVLSDKINYQIRKRMCVVFRTNMFRSFQGGSIRGSSVYTTHLTVRHIPGTEAYFGLAMTSFVWNSDLIHYTLFFYKNYFYKNHQAQILKN